MTDRNEMIRRIEERLGSCGTPEDAARMFDVLKAAGRITFSPDSGFEMIEMDEFEWQRFEAEV